MIPYDILHHSRVIMVVAGGLVFIWRHGICNHSGAAMSVVTRDDGGQNRADCGHSTSPYV